MTLTRRPPLSSRAATASPPWARAASRTSAKPSPLPPATLLPRRALGGELSGLESGTFGYGYFWHLPLVSCSNYTQLATLYTLSPAECATRCSSVTTASNSPNCNSFMYARYDPAPPRGLPPTPAGQAWNRCVLMGMIEAQLSNCTPKPIPKRTLKPSVDWYSLELEAGVTFDTYLSWLRPTAASPSDWVQGSLTMGGLTAAQLQLAPRSPLAVSVSEAMIQALQSRCCASFVELTNVTDVGPKPSALIHFRARMLAGATGAIPFLQSNLVDVLYGAEGEAALLAALEARGVNVTNVSVLRPAGTAVVCPAPPPWASRIDLLLLRRFIIALAVCVVLLTTALVLALHRKRKRTAEAARAAVRTRPHDVFISFYNQDVQIADHVRDELQLAGLRVCMFCDRDNGTAKSPFQQQQLMKAVRGAPLIAAVVSLESLRQWAALKPDKPDCALAEFVLASHLMRRGVVRRIFPLLVGAWQDRPLGGRREREYLPGTAQFKHLCAQLPDVVPTATLALVASMLADERRGETLDTCFERATVRDLLLGLGTTPARGARAFAGLLQIHSVSLDGPQEHEGLVLRHRYVQSIVAVLRKA